ncbi:MAG: manganese efflux pump MntP family protein [Bacteroidetes bacterium]|nr:manganese efflux pump MntP family protein [Bacteroidota bacterium]
MSFLELILIALGLSMDSFAVSLTSGTLHCVTPKKGLKIAVVFAVFQAIMPVLGWLLGLTFKDLIEQIDHWIAFSLLFIIGLKMIYEAVKVNQEERKFNINKNYVLIMLALATTIDAFVVGISFGFLNVSIIKASIIIGLVTFIVSYGGICLGKLNRFIKPRSAELIGGLVLIGIGIKILLEHLKVF